MCLLSYYPPGVAPDEGALRAGLAINGDGYGWAVWSAPGQITSMRTLDGEEAAAGFLEWRRAHPGGPALFHSRWLTAGEGGVGNCHPFDVPGVGVIAHNGTLPGLARGARTDTQVFAEDIVPGYAGRLPALEKFMGPGNKAVVLTLEGAGVILGERYGLWRGREWHSSADCVPPGPVPAQPKAALRLLYRDLGLAQANGDPRAGAARAALLAEFPALKYGMELVT